MKNLLVCVILTVCADNNLAFYVYVNMAASRGLSGFDRDCKYCFVTLCFHFALAIGLLWRTCRVVWLLHVTAPLYTILILWSCAVRTTASNTPSVEIINNSLKTLIVFSHDYDARRFCDQCNSSCYSLQEHTTWRLRIVIMPPCKLCSEKVWHVPTDARTDYNRHGDGCDIVC